MTFELQGETGAADSQCAEVGFSARNSIGGQGTIICRSAAPSVNEGREVESIKEKSKPPQRANLG